MNETSKPKKQVGGILLLLALTGLTVWIFLKDYSPRQLSEALGKANPLYLLAGLGMMFLFVCCEAVNMKLIFHELSLRVPFRRCAGYAFIGFYFSSITPSSSGGQPMQMYYMNKDRIPVTYSSVAIFFIVLIYQIAMLLLGGLMYLIRPELAGQMAGKLGLLLVYGVIMNAAAVAGILLLMYSRRTVPFLVNLAVRIGSRLHLIRDPGAARTRLHESIRTYHEKTGYVKKNPSLFFKVLFVTMIQMTALNLVPWFVYCGLGFSGHSFLDFLTCQSILTISVSAVPLPGAVGAAEGGFLWAFGLLFPQSVLATAMIISRGISFYLFLLISFIICFTIHLRMFGRRRKKDLTYA